MNPLLATLLLPLIIIPVQTNTFLPAANIDARHVILYALSTIKMVDQAFPVNFQITFATTPTFAFSMNQYKMGDTFYIQNFNSHASSLLLTQVIIQVSSVGSTNPLLFSISYIAVESQSNIDANYFSYTSATNISTGSGDRYFQVFLTYSFASSNVQILPFLTGFYITTTVFHSILISASYHSSINYRVLVSTSSTSVIHRVDFYVLLLLEDGLNGTYYYVAGADVFYSTDVNAASWVSTINNYSSTQFILGVRGMDGFAILRDARWGWSISTVVSDVATLTFDKSQLQHLYFSYLQIAAYPTTTNPTTPTATEQSSGSSLGIIAGLIVGVVIIAIVVFLLCKFYSKKTAVIYNTPEDDKMKEMPTISL